MTCVKCGHEFCWTCLADRQVIYAHGNHFHAKDCPFYFAYDGPPEFIPERCPRCRRTGKPCQLQPCQESDAEPSEEGAQLSQESPRFVGVWYLQAIRAFAPVMPV
jgi:hypothetical protein